ncbi:unnamed protein product [Callosobruchus maculatus]|nr:unnamed protein product [Callosobruchus maculatus]
MISRYASGDIDIGDNITVPEGASIAIPILQIHRSGEYWEDPLKFDPDRFLPDAAKRHPLSYLGFSHGPRNCIGMRYAMLNMKLAIAMALRRLRFFSEYKSVEEIEISLTLFLKMRDGPKVWIKNR